MMQFVCVYVLQPLAHIPGCLSMDVLHPYMHNAADAHAMLLVALHRAHHVS